MPTLASRRLGECQFDDNDKLIFPNGLPGYEHLHEFALVRPDPEVPLSVLQSAEDAEVSFVVTSPFLFYPDYQFDLAEAYREKLEFRDGDDVNDLQIYVILSLREPFPQSTMNLLAPLVVHTRKRIGVQAVLHGIPYTTRHPLPAGTASDGGE